jgi:hypothetical protein
VLRTAWSLGTLLGLVLGKSGGISLVSWLAVNTGLAVPGLSQRAASGLSTCVICEVDQPPLVAALVPPVCAYREPAFWLKNSSLCAVPNLTKQHG